MDSHQNKIGEHVADHLAAVSRLTDQWETIAAIAETTANALSGRRRLYLIGNGGSAADAQHVAGELVGRFATDRAAFPAVALTTDTSILTAIGNDYSYEDIFSRQVSAHLQEGDVLWAFSTSGDSENVVRGAQSASELGGLVIGFTGKSGGRLKTLCHHCLCADHLDTWRVQEVHMVAYHIVCLFIEQRMATKS
jgi:D-sedoheptulose 7-phosphate isomerase